MENLKNAFKEAIEVKIMKDYPYYMIDIIYEDYSYEIMVTLLNHNNKLMEFYINILIYENNNIDNVELERKKVKHENFEEEIIKQLINWHKGRVK